MNKLDTAEVRLWDRTIGAVAWLNDRQYAVFEFEPEFLNSGQEVAPIHMPLDSARRGDGIFSFPALNRDTYRGLPGMLADALPDKFGNSVIDTWLARNGRDVDDFSPVERLCYTGVRGMGALEFQPSGYSQADKSVPLEVSALVELAQEVSSQRTKLDVNVRDSDDDTTRADAMLDILRVGTSAGGARPKAVIAMDDAGHVRSGQVEAPRGYDYWIIKFDGVDDLELGKPRDYGRIEYAYYLMARAAGIEMAESRLLEENGRAHFLTRRFDRIDGRKLHMQTLCGIAHYDFNRAGETSYEQVFSVMRRLRLSRFQAAQQFRRMVFNVLARNQDDHTKNIAFLMDVNGEWRLSPAYDLTYAHNPAGRWTQLHQMSLAGKRDKFTLNDLLQVGDSISLPDPASIIDEVSESLAGWPAYAAEAGLGPAKIRAIGNAHRSL